MASLHPQMQARIDALGPEPDALSVRIALREPYGPAERWDLEVDDLTAPGPRGPVTVRRYAPRGLGSLAPGLVWLHGGSFDHGDLDMPEGDAVARGVAGRGGAVVLSVDYRLAPMADGSVGRGRPEWRFPAGLDDVVAGFTRAASRAEEMGIDPARLAIGGASAGGCLAAGAVLRLQQQGIRPWQLLMAYPVLHPVLPEPSPELAAALRRMPPSLGFPPELVASMCHNYLGGAEPVPEAFPGLAPDLSGFPETYLENAELDDLRSSGEQFAQQLRAAGVDVEQVTCPDVPHGHLNRLGLDAASATMDRLAARLSR
ncbi:alpha/beta hydrolase [Luteococcus peritonei]|uniref:Alpha/beta hydrolase n=1 Tax=Luteococcus peritonei TaxID=88874 RepID=A0ABW4RVR1_9ACTN